VAPYSVNVLNQNFYIVAVENFANKRIKLSRVFRGWFD
jgi:hypothetical protein